MRNYQLPSEVAMMNSTLCHHTSGSTNSSEEIESQHGSPETKLTAFSPEDVRLKTRLGEYKAVRSNLPPAFAFGQPGDHPGSTNGILNIDPFGSQDPFVTNSGAVFRPRSPRPQPRLSPGASSFTPLESREWGSSSGLKLNWESTITGPQYQGNIMKTGYLPRTSTCGALAVDDSPEQLRVPTMSKSLASQLGPIPQNPALKIEVVPVKMGYFSSDGETSRSLIISDVSPRTSPKEVDEFFSLDIFSSLRDLILVDLIAAGRIYLNLPDIRDAHKAYAKVKSHRKDWNVQYVTGAKSSTKQQPESSVYMPIPMYDGQVIVKADFGGPRQQFNASCIGHLIRELLENYGEIMGYEACLSKHPTATCRAEFYNTTATDSALSYLNGFKIGGCTLSITRYRPDHDRLSSQFGNSHGPLIIGQQESNLERAFGSLNIKNCGGVYSDELLGPSFVSTLNYTNPSDRSPSYQREFVPEPLPSPPELYTPSFTPRSSVPSPPWSPAYSPYSNYGFQSPAWPGYYPGTIGQERGAPMLPQARVPYPIQQQRHSGKTIMRQGHEYGSAHHNVVDVERIRQGTDVRTTIMLRNIPNKIDQAMLKDIVDEISHGKYDFMYLRIDFANNCNVGYAFINFEDPYFIIDFVNARAGHRWNRYSSDKVAEVSYATIQGRDCLVQKFRNSSVMLEHPGFRPKIFHTGKGPLAGTEDTFPGPDNPSKMRRSVENAEHVGLFAPRAGQNFRDEQRRRRSQYDRGTRLAEIEDAYDFDNAGLGHGTNYLYGPNSPIRYRRYPHQLHEPR